MDRTSVLGLSPLGFEYCVWGTGFVDFDNDAWLGLWISYGRTHEQLEMRNRSVSFAEPTSFCGIATATSLRFCDPINSALASMQLSAEGNGQNQLSL
jgi:hypothetical protein